MKALAYVVGGILATLLIVGILGGGGYGIYRAFSGSDSSNASLHLASGEISESDYRASIRASLLNPLMAAQCSALQGLSGQEAYRALADSEANDIANSAGVGESNVGLSEAELKARISTLQTAQAQLVAIATFAASSDAGRAGRIIQEECARIRQ